MKPEETIDFKKTSVGKVSGHSDFSWVICFQLGARAPFLEIPKKNAKSYILSDV